MIIDVILDRKAGCDYSPVYLIRYTDTRVYGRAFQYILDAFWDEDETAIRAALCRYIDAEGYNPDVKDYINSVNWLK